MSVVAWSLVWALFVAAPGHDTVQTRFAAPAGFTRVDVEDDSFGAFVRALPLLPPGTPVRSFRGTVIDAPAAAVVDLDVGTSDLQQCADSAMRVYAQWRRTRADVDTLQFHATSGDVLPWARWRAGERPVVVKDRVQWRAARAFDDSPASYRAYLDAVFTWAGSRSLARDTVPVVDEVRPGDLLVIGGSPGHVLVVLDVAQRRDARGAIERRVIVGQGYMPAQSFHVVDDDGDGDPWLVPDAAGAIRVPTWPTPFPRSSARRFVLSR